MRLGVSSSESRSESCGAKAVGAKAVGANYETE